MRGESAALARLTVWWRRGNLAVAALLLWLNLIGFASVVQSFVSGLHAPPLHFQYDFTAYYIAAAALNRQQAILYNDAAIDAFAASMDMQGRYSRYVYPPFFAVLLRPLATLPHIPAIVIWAILNLGLLAWSVRQLLMIWAPATPIRWRLYALALAVVLMLPPVYLDLFVYGQNNVLMLYQLPIERPC